MRLTFRESIGSLRFRRYQHNKHGVVETLTAKTVVYVRPVFGLLKKDKAQEREVAQFRAQTPKAPKAKRGRRLGLMWAKRKEASR
jgi:hypothetical protein